MSRYIDADKYRKDLIELGFLPALVVSVLDKQPTADVVEVVRCKDCRHYIYDGGKYPYCNIMSNIGEGEYYQPSDDHFCSYGERK